MSCEITPVAAPPSVGVHGPTTVVRPSPVPERPTRKGLRRGMLRAYFSELLRFKASTGNVHDHPRQQMCCLPRCWARLDAVA